MKKATLYSPNSRNQKCLNEKCPQCGKPLREVIGKFGPFIACSGYPECKYIHKNVAKVNVLTAKAILWNVAGKAANSGVAQTIQNVSLQCFQISKKRHVQNVNVRSC